MNEEKFFGKHSKGEIITDENQEFYSQHDIYKFIATVDSRIKKEVGSDFVLAKLEDKDKEYVVEMVGNAFSMKGLIDGMLRRINENHKDRTKIKLIGERIFDNLMTKVYMIVLLNRNVDKNYIMKIIGESREDVEDEETSKVKQVLDKLRNKDEVSE